MPATGYGQQGTWKPSAAIAKLDRKLRRAIQQTPKPESVIIRAKDGNLELLKQALEAHGDIIESEHPEINALSVVVHGEDLLPLAEFDGTASVSENAEVRAAGGPGSGTGKKAKVKARKTKKKGAARRSSKKSDSTSGDTPTEILGLERKLQGLGYGMPTGRGVGIAVVDSGIDTSDDTTFSGVVSAFYDFTQDSTSPVPTSPYDNYGHGTHIASLIANQGKDDEGRYQGVAPGAHLIGMKVLDGTGAGKTSDVIRAIEFAIQYKAVLDVDVINLSLGHPVFESAATDPLVRAVEAAHRAGIVVAVSSGNFGMNPETRQPGYGGITSPGNAPSAITVGAVDTKKTVQRSDDRVASFSSRGPSWIDGFAKPDLVGPGVGEVGKASRDGDLYRLYPQLLYDDDDGDSLDYGKLAKLSGTSMAAAIASGVVALVMEAKPGLHANAVKAILEYSATPLVNDLGEPYDALTQGVGEVNGMGAIEVAWAIDPTAPAGAPWMNATAGMTLFGSEAAAWSQNIVWGNYVVRGIDSLFVNNAAWDDNIVWGTVGADENIVWGNFARDENDNIVWGNLSIWGSLADEEQDNIVWGTFDREDDNIVWGTVTLADTDGDQIGDNIVWGNNFSWDDNIVWGNQLLGYRTDAVAADADGDGVADGGTGDNIVWGNSETGDDNIVWGNLSGWDGDGDNIVWGNLADDNIVWGNSCGGDGCTDENIVWGNAVLLGNVK